jgi:putative transposase
MEGRKKRRTYNVPGDAHELTFSIYRRLPLLARTAARDLFIACLDRARKSGGFRIIAYVVMPNHVHLLVIPDGKPISQILTAVKAEFAKQLLKQLRASSASVLEELRVTRRDGTSRFRIWQSGGGYDRNLFSPSAIRAAIEYLHANPVRSGLCATIVDWKWSSARWHYGLEAEFQIDGFE